MDILPNDDQLRLYLYLLNHIKIFDFRMGYKNNLYIDGGTNKNSKYEQKSNNLDIAVISKSDIEAKILLVLLRIIVDREWDYINKIYDTDYDYIYNQFRYFISIIHYDFDNVSSFYYKNNIIINDDTIKSYKDMDIWTYDRIKQYFLDILNRHTNFNIF